MKKIKSIFALLLLGSLTMTGCDLFKKKGNNTPSDGGGGGGGGGGGVVDRFTNKKFNYDSCDVPEAGAGYEDTYVSFFTEGDFEVVLGNYVMCGDYTLSPDKQSASMTMKKQKSAYGEYVFPEGQQETMNVDYVASTNKYSVATTNPETGQTAHIYYVDSGEQPTHYEFPPAQTVSIRFDKNAADAEGEMNPLTKNKGEVFQLPSSGFTYDGHTFQGWSESATEGTVYSVGDPYSTQVDVTLYARWQEVPAGKVTVTFDANASGTTGETAPIEVDPGEAFYLPECGFSLEGYDFIGWCVEAIPSNPEAIHPVGVECSVAASTTYYAQWQAKGSEETNPPFVQFGSGETWEFVQLVEDSEHDDQYKVSIELAKGQEFVICVDKTDLEDQDWRHFEDLGEAVAQVIEGSGEGEHNFKANATGTYDLYVKKAKGGKVYVVFTPIDFDPVVLYGDPANFQEATLVVDTEVENQYKLEDLHLNADDEFVIHIDYDTWRHYDDMNKTYSSAASVLENVEESGNFKVTAAGTFDIYVKTVLDSDNKCVYVNYDADPTPEVFSLSATSGTITSGGSIDVTASHVTGVLHYEVTLGTAAVVIDGSKATISSSTVGTATIAFSDDSEATPIVYTLTVNEAATSLTVYLQTKNFFNSGASSENVKAYCWDSKDGEKNNTWPGEAMTWVEDQENNQKIFKFDVDLTKYDSVLFTKTVNDTATLKTADILLTSFTAENNCVYLDANDWSGLDTPIPVGFFHFVPASI